MDSNIYSLLVEENGRNFNYYCLIADVSAPVYSWVLFRGSEMLSTGLVEHTDLSTMLVALHEDLNGRSEWENKPYINRLHLSRRPYGRRERPQQPPRPNDAPSR